MKKITLNRLFLLFSSAFLMGLSMQPISLGFIAWFSLLPFLYILFTSKSYKEIFIYSFLWGIIYHSTVVFWLSTNIGAPNQFIALLSMIGSVLVLSMSTVAISSIWFYIKLKLPQYSFTLFPVVWVCIEYIRSYGFLGFPWVSIANSQIDYLYLIQNAEVTGIYGISFWVIMINVLLFQLIFHNRNQLLLFFLVFIFIIPWIMGYFLFKNVNNNMNVSGSYLTVSMLQPNIHLDDKRDVNKAKKITSKLIETTNSKYENSDLVIWPESSYPYYINLDIEPSRRIYPKKENFLLFGSVIEQKRKRYNSSVLMNSEGIIDVYHKRQLVPIVEYIPFLQKTDLGIAPFSKGLKDVIFDVDNFNIMSLVCFESTFPEINRRHVNSNDGVDALVYLVNDGWYENPPEPQQHAKQSIYRAIENRRPVLRCANTGISMYISPNGVVLNQLDLNKKGSIDNIKIYKNNYKTFYTTYGNVFALILLIINIGFIIGAYFKNEKAI